MCMLRTLLHFLNHNWGEPIPSSHSDELASAFLGNNYNWSEPKPHTIVYMFCKICFIGMVEAIFSVHVHVVWPRIYEFEGQGSVWIAMGVRTCRRCVHGNVKFIVKINVGFN